MYSHTSSGDLTEPSNYRPIVFVSVLSKLFTSILTNRLLSWSEDEDTLIDNQFRFRSGKSTIDAIFTIQCIISHQLENKEKRFCAFVDFRKAFDKVDRKILMYKLMKNGINSKFVSIIKSVYASVQLRIRSGGIISGAFDNQLGVKQIEPMSPLLFLFFINDIIHDISANTNDNIVSLDVYFYLFDFVRR